MKPAVVLIDFSNLFWTNWHASASDPVSHARERTREAIERASNTVPGALVAVCLDAGRSFRKGLLDTYKANRPEKDATVLAEMDRCKQALRERGYLLWGADGFEADDVIATACEKAVEEGHEVVIASADKDLLQLVRASTSRPPVSQLRTHDWSTWDAAKVVEKFGVEPEGLGDWLALVGDASDNIKGAKGVGPKTATALLVKHGGLDILLGRVGELITGIGTGGAPYVETMTPAAKAIGTPAVVNALWSGRSDIELARKLVTLRTDAPIRFEDIYEKRETKAMENAKKDMGTVDEVIVESKLAAAAKDAGEKKQDAAPTPTPTGRVVEPETTALVAVGVTYERALEPRDPRGALSLGEVLFESRAYSRFPSAAAITAVIMRGRELGIPAIASLDAFHFMTDMGRIAPSWQVIVTLAEKSPQCEYICFVEGDDKSATWETKHRKNPRPQRLTYTIAQAERAGLLDIKPGKQPGNWHKRPDEMVRKTAAIQLARLVYPGATLGLYADFEVEDTGQQGEISEAA